VSDANRVQSLVCHRSPRSARLHVVVCTCSCGTALCSTSATVQVRRWTVSLNKTGSSAECVGELGLYPSPRDSLRHGLRCPRAGAKRPRLVGQAESGAIGAPSAGLWLPFPGTIMRARGFVRSAVGGNQAGNPVHWSHAVGATALPGQPEIPGGRYAGRSEEWSSWPARQPAP